MTATWVGKTVFFLKDPVPAATMKAEVTTAAETDTPLSAARASATPRQVVGLWTVLRNLQNT